MKRNSRLTLLTGMILAVAVTAHGDLGLPRSALVGEWLFDEGSGNVAYDTSGNGHHGQINGANWVSGVSGSALDFSGDSVYIGTSLLGGATFGDLTFEAWFRTSVVGSDPYSAIFANETSDGEFNIGIKPDGRAYGQVYTVGGNANLYGPQVNDNQSHHIIVSRSGNEAALYLDGVKYDSAPVSGNLRITTRRTVTIGEKLNSAYFNGMIDEVRIYNQGFRFDPPPPQPRPDPIPDPVSSKSNLVLYTHGWRTSESDFTELNGSWGKLDTALKAAVGSDWEVQEYSWTQDSGSLLTGPGYALNKAMEHGRAKGAQVGNADYDHVHIIAHSAGSAFATIAAEHIKALSPDTDVHITFLDPYVGLGSGHRIYGAAADWADNYFAKDWTPLTQVSLPKAHNVDITWLDPDKDVDSLGQAMSSHGWPVDWYRATVDDIDLPAGSGNYGFPLSLEGGGWNPSSYPVGNDPVELGGGSSGTTDIVVRNDAVLSITDSTNISSDTGIVNITGTGFSMLTGSPVWMTTLVETDDIVNFLTFEADFTSAPGAEGLLAVYWENEVLGLIDERYVLDGVQEYTMLLPGNFEPGDYLLGFRLDPYTAVDSSVLIDNVSTGFVTPEPATLTLLALGGLAVLRKRRKQ